jgi:hypothetical protein
MTKQQKVKNIVTRLEVLATLADELELALPNGAIVGNMLMGIALDLQPLVKSKSNVITMIPSLSAVFKPRTK